MGLSCACAAVTRSEGKVRILAVCTAERLALLPDVPALAESLPGFQATAWHGLFAPPEIVAKINAEVRKMAADPGFQEKVFAPTHFRSLASTPAEFAAMLRSEYGVEEVRRRREDQDRLMRHQGGHRFRRCRPMGSTVWFIAAKQPCNH